MAEDIPKSIKTSDDVKVPDKLISQVVGQKKAVEIIKKAARQRRHVLLIGEPGVGKTMLAQAMAEMLPATELEDTLVYRNPNDENVPLVKSVKTYPEGFKVGIDGQGRNMLQKERTKGHMQMGGNASTIALLVFVVVIILTGLVFFGFIKDYNVILISALILGLMIMGSVAMLMGGLGRRVGMGMPGMGDTGEPKLIVDNTGMNLAPH